MNDPPNKLEYSKITYADDTERLLIEREACMEKYQTKVLTVRTERSEARTKKTEI